MTNSYKPTLWYRWRDERWLKEHHAGYSVIDIAQKWGYSSRFVQKILRYYENRD